MQSTGQTSTHAVSFVPMQGSQMIYATRVSSRGSSGLAAEKYNSAACSALAAWPCWCARISRPQRPVWRPATWRRRRSTSALFAPAGAAPAPIARTCRRSTSSHRSCATLAWRCLAAPSARRLGTAGDDPVRRVRASGSYNRWKVARLYRRRRASGRPWPRWTRARRSPGRSSRRTRTGAATSRAGTLIIVLRDSVRTDADRDVASSRRSPTGSSSPRHCWRRCRSGSRSTSSTRASRPKPRRTCAAA